MTEEKKTPNFWTCVEHAERLTYTDRDEAIGMFLEDYKLEDQPEKVTVYGYAKQTLPEGEPWHGQVLEAVLEPMDEDYGDPEESFEATPAMVEAAKVFCAVIRKEFRVWTCELVCQEIVNTAEWVKEHAPHWLEDQK